MRTGMRWACAAHHREGPDGYRPSAMADGLSASAMPTSLRIGDADGSGVICMRMDMLMGMYGHAHGHVRTHALDSVFGDFRGMPTANAEG